MLRRLAPVGLVLALVLAGCASDAAPAPTSGGEVQVGETTASINQADCDDDPDPAPTDGDVLGVGTVVFSSTARATTPGGDELVVEVDRLEVESDEGEVVVTYDLASVTGADRAWEGWRATGPGADAFTSPLDDVVDLDATIEGGSVDATGSLSALDRQGLPTDRTIEVTIAITCDGDASDPVG